MNTPSDKKPETTDIKHNQVLQKEQLVFSTSVNSILQFYPDTFTLILNIENVFIPESLKVAASGYNLLPKNDFHITIIGSRTSEQIQEYLNQLNIASKKVFIMLLKKLVHRYPFKVMLENDIFYINKSYKDEERFSFIQIVKVDQLENFYRELNQLLWLEFPIPFPHLTLFTNSSNPEKKLMWIWIYSKDEFKKLEPIKIN